MCCAGSVKKSIRIAEAVPVAVVVRFVGDPGGDTGFAKGAACDGHRRPPRGGSGEVELSIGPDVRKFLVDMACTTFRPPQVSRFGIDSNATDSWGNVDAVSDVRS